MKMYLVGTCQKHFGKGLLMSNHSCFHGEINFFLIFVRCFHLKVWVFGCVCGGGGGGGGQSPTLALSSDVVYTSLSKMQV